MPPRYRTPRKSQYSHLLKPEPIKPEAGTSQPHIIQLHPPQKELGASIKGTGYEIPVKRVSQVEQVVTAGQFQAQPNDSGEILINVHFMRAW